ncbi:MAG: GntR family transcriptional regulator [Pseudomonadota bacterium]
MVLELKTAVEQKADKGQPLYRQVAAELRTAIAEGKHPVGTLLPTEQELCERFETSRYTVREALRLLAEDGLVKRRQGRGTEVSSRHRRAVFAQSLSSLSQLDTYADETVLSIDRVMKVVPDDAMAMQLGRAPGREWLLAEGVRRTLDGSIICVAQVFINTEFSELAPELKTLNCAIYVAIAERFGVEAHQVHQHIKMERADNATAALLGIAPGDWAVVVRRRYLAEDDRPILVSLNWHRGEEFSYSQIILRD